MSLSHNAKEMDSPSSAFRGTTNKKVRQLACTANWMAKKQGMNGFTMGDMYRHKMQFSSVQL